ncbi:MAG TPA: universal stress protein [Acidimicrobiales bacterium]|jgi:nucleotide-binding universal stress UspA family protein
MFDRILLALDDSSSGEMAVAFACGLAPRCGARVHVLHVNEYLVAGGGTTLRSREEALALVTAAVDDLRRCGVGASASVRVAHYRKVAHCIVEAAEEQHAGAIILGSRRQRRLGRLFSPQVRERVTRLGSLPVLTAPSPLAVPRRPDLSPSELVMAEIERALSIPS